MSEITRLAKLGRKISCLVMGEGPEESVINVPGPYAESIEVCAEPGMSCDQVWLKLVLKNGEITMVNSSYCSFVRFDKEEEAIK